MAEKRKFDVRVWYEENSYGKAWTTIEAETEEEALEILKKAHEEDTIWDMDWDYYDKGGEGITFEFDAPVGIGAKEFNV